MFSNYQSYRKGMRQLGPASFSAVKDEFLELLEDRSLEELSDVVHSILRSVKAPLIISFLLAYPTANKHARRVKLRGCARSERNCKKSGNNCSCKKSQATS